MVADNRDNNIFRYMHLRPARAARVDSRSNPTAGTAVIRRTRPALPSLVEAAGSRPDAPVRAKRELTGLNLASDLVLSEAGERGSPSFFLTAAAGARLSPETQAVL